VIARHVCLALLLPLFGIPTSSLAAAPAKPNILVFYMDDMGWGQPGCYGGIMAATPHIDDLAARGVRFTDGYSSGCICSPGRVGLMTGRYQARTGHDANPTARGRELLLSETTMAQRLKLAGYATGLVGKWHLGVTTPEYMPQARGFDFAVGTVGNLGEGAGPAFFRGQDKLDDLPGAPVTSPIFARESVGFMEAHQGQPWFLWVSYNAVHTPHVASEKWLEKFSHLPQRDQRYAALIAEADESIGAVLARLRALGQEENTLIFLISDNGGAYANAELGGLRGRKWFVWEEGIRVSWIAAWKGRVPGGRVVTDPVIQLDVLPTALAAAGVETKSEWQIDGVNLLPLLDGKVKQLAPRALYFRFGVQQAVRQGDWKLVKATKEMEPMLVNLAEDRGEQVDLSAKYPEKKKELQSLLATWNASMQPPRWIDERWNGDENREKTKAGAKQKGKSKD
jgi:arylsulfatase A-like enzyme